MYLTVQDGIVDNYTLDPYFGEAGGSWLNEYWHTLVPELEQWKTTALELGMHRSAFFTSDTDTDIWGLVSADTDPIPI